MHRTLLLAVVVASTGCPKGSLVNTPCNELGAETCEDAAPLRCDGRRWQQLGECSGACLADTVATHDEEEIPNDITWACTEGVHLVNNTVNIASGATLTVEEGVHIRLAPAARITTEPGARIVAVGTNLVPILLTSDNGEKGGFGGLTAGGLNVYADADAEPSMLKQVIIERGIHGLGVLGLEDGVPPPTIEDCTFRDNLNWGIIVRGCVGTPAIPDFAAAGNQFFGNDEGEVSPCL